MAVNPKPDVQTLYENYGRAVYSRCYYFLREKAAAQDAFHEVFIKVIQHYGEFKGESSPLTWMIRITTHHCLNILRAKKAAWHQQHEQSVQVEAQQKPHDIALWERRELVRSLLLHMPKEVQEAAIYYFVDDMNQDEAAAAAQCSLPTLRKRLRTFVDIARRELKKDQPDLIFGKALI